MSRDPELEKLRVRIEEAVSRMTPREVRVSPERIREFCAILGEDNPVYWDLDVAQREGFPGIPIPESYLLTLLAPVSQELFTEGLGHLFGNLIQGIIHTSSVIECREVLYCHTPYALRVGFTELVRKKGKMGRYFAATFPHSVFGPGGREVAVDRHVFFLRTRS